MGYFSNDLSTYAIYTPLAFLILLQFIYIHTQIRSMRESIIMKGLSAEASAEKVSKRETRLRVYPLFVNLKMVNLFSRHSSLLKNELKQIIDQENHILPYVCSRSVENVNVEFTKVGLLVTETGGGADALYTDVKNEFIRYILIKGQVFMISVNDSISDYLVNYTRTKKMENEEYMLVNSKVFVLFPLHNHEVVKEDKAKVESVACRFELAPFLGESFRRAGSDYVMDLNIELVPNSIATRIPMHVIGYRT